MSNEEQHKKKALSIKAKKYKRQNSKLLTLNFSKPAFVAKSKIVIPALMNRSKRLKSMGMTTMFAVEYCLQEHVLKDFLMFVNAKRKSP